MLVLCDGMPRSASTWSFNVVMALLRGSACRDRVFGGYDEDVARFLGSVPDSAVHVVLKCHTLDAAGRTLARSGAAKTVYTWRNLADALVSFMRMFGYGFDHSYSVMRTSLELYRFHLESGNAAILSYEEATRYPGNAIRRIAEYLGTDNDSRLIESVAEAISFERLREKAEELEASEVSANLIRLERTAYDPETLLNLHHIRDGGSGYGRRALSPEQLERVDSLVREYGLPDDKSDLT